MRVTPPTNIGTMPIADKVHRYVNANYYKTLLTALQAAADEVGCAFALSHRADEYIPADIREHLAFHLALAREQYLRPTLGPIAHCANAESCMEDGFAMMLLDDIMAALSALGLKYQIKSVEYYDRTGVHKAQDRRRNGGFPPLSPASPEASTTELDLLASALPVTAEELQV